MSPVMDMKGGGTVAAATPLELLLFLSNYNNCLIILKRKITSYNISLLMSRLLNNQTQEVQFFIILI